MYQGSIEGFGGEGRLVAVTRHASFVLDTQGRGANPGDALLAALCGCVGHYVRDFCAERGVALAGFTVLAEARPTPDQSRLAGISLRIDLGEARLDPAQEPALVAAAERCKLYGTLRRACPVEIAVARRQEAVAAAGA